jgi:hypothetical protein
MLRATLSSITVWMCRSPELVGEHHRADGSARLFAAAEEFPAGTERIRLGAGCEGLAVLGVVAFAGDKTAADREVGLLEKGVVPAVGGESHPVCVPGEDCEGPEDDSLEAELDLPHAPENQRAGAVNAGDGAVDSIGFDDLGIVPLKANSDRGESAVAVPGGSQRSEQFNADPVDGVQRAGCVEVVSEGGGGPHRTNGVRAAGPHADAEHVEDAYGHSCGSQFLEVRSGRRRL